MESPQIELTFYFFLFVTPLSASIEVEFSQSNDFKMVYKCNKKACELPIILIFALISFYLHSSCLLSIIPVGLFL